MTTAWSPYMEAARAETTRRFYAEHWRSFELWCAVQGKNPLPATPATVCAYFVARVEAGDRVSTIRVRMSAIRAYHEGQSHESPTLHPDVRRVIRGIARQQAHVLPAQVAGLTAAVLQRIEASLNMRWPTHRVAVALCWVMRDAMLRSSEAAAMRWEDVERDRDGSGRLLIRRSKTDQTGLGHVAYLSRQCMKALDRIRPDNAQGRIFPVHTRTIGRRIAAAAQRAGLNGRFRGHSPRVGMSLDLAENGASLVEMQQVGRWKSPTMPAKYARAVMAKRGAVARFYGEQRSA